MAPDAPPQTTLPALKVLQDPRFHGIEAGPANGPLVILLHGFPDLSWGFRYQITALAEAGFHVVAPDQRGYGRSFKPRHLRDYELDRLAADVLALADAYDAPSFHLAGHDWGGLIAWWVAQHHPARVERLAILNAPHPDAWSHMVRYRGRQALRSWYVGFFQIPLLPEAVLSAGNFTLMRRALRLSAHRGIFSEADLDLYTAAWAQPHALTCMLNYYRALRYRRPSRSPHISSPTLLIWGEQDAFLLRATAEASLALCAAPRACFVPDATHWVQLEKPSLVNAALLDFFQHPR